MDIDSILNLYSKTYFNLPRPIKTFLGQIYGSIPLKVRFGKEYEVHRRLIEKYENSNNQFKQDFTFAKTFETIQFAYENIPYYTKLFNDNGFKPNEFKSFEDLKKIPYLTKSIIQNNLKSLYTDRIDKPIAVNTGGSTFTPTKFFISLNKTRSKERAYNNYIFSKLGFVYRDKTLALRDKDRSNQKKGVFWDYETVANQLWVSPNHVNSKNIEPIFKEVKLFKPKYIWGYPSQITLFINECKKKGIDKLDGASGVFLTSELVFPDQMGLINNFFNCRILTHFGHSESTTIGYRIDQQEYKFLNSYGLSRVVDNELITTSFDNFVMPFINYKTQDFVTGKCNFIENSDVTG